MKINGNNIEERSKPKRKFDERKREERSMRETTRERVQIKLTDYKKMVKYR